MHLLKKLWDPTTPIETVFVNGHMCRNFATTGDNPITDATYIQQLVKTFTNSGVFTQAIHKWNLKTTVQKTMAKTTLSHISLGLVSNVASLTHPPRTLLQPKQLKSPQQLPKPVPPITPIAGHMD